jgi:WD40 repeat-containing protein SMU1
VDGFLEVYNHLSGVLRKDLLYQAKGENMLMDSACLSLSFSSDSQSLVTGAQDGTIYIWNIITGVLQKSIVAHGEGVCFVKFDKNASKVLTGSFDATVK